MRSSELIAIVTRTTRLDSLKQKRSTWGSAKFVLQRARALESEARAKAGITPAAAAAFQVADYAASSEEYEDEDTRLRQATKFLERELELGYPITHVKRKHIPNFDFRRCVLVVVVGQDGLVANVAKYVGDVPILGINPDPRRYDGILVPHRAEQARELAQQALRGRGHTRSVTLGEVSLNDGQSLLAFNDFFVGCKSHQSARYTLRTADRAEPQSSSGILIATGAGSTGWMSSVMNMTRGIVHALSGTELPPAHPLGWEERKLRWAVREPFLSQHSSADLVFGELMDGSELVVESLMPQSGVIFSDGLESDFLEFNSGTIARIGVSKQRANLLGVAPVRPRRD